MTDQAQQNTRPDRNDEFTRLATQGITDLGDDQAAAWVPVLSGYDDPGQRSEIVDTVFDDPRIKGAEHVTVAVPRGDSEALDAVWNRLEDEHTRSAGASILVEGRPSTGTARATGGAADVPQPRAADAADAISTARDLRADSRDQRADTRDQRADRRDGVSGSGDADAASDRSAARRDRQASAADRRHAKDDRESAGTDRRTSAAAASALAIDDLTGNSLRGPGIRELDREVARATRPGGGRSSWSAMTSTASKTRTTRSAPTPGTGS